MSVIKIQNEKIKEKVINSLAENNIKISKNNIKKSLDEYKKMLDIGHPFFRPFNFKKRNNITQKQYEDIFKTLKEDIDVLFKSKKENVEEIQRLEENIKNNQIIIKNSLKALESQINVFRKNPDTVNEIYTFNFDKTNNLEFLTTPYTDALINLDQMKAFNDIKEFKPYKVNELEFDVYAETLVNNVETINTIEEVYNNRKTTLYQQKCFTEDKKEVTIHIDVINHKQDKQINELVLKLQNKQTANVKLYINNSGEYILQKSEDIISDITFDINREVKKFRLAITKKHDEFINGMYEYLFLIENLFVNRNTFKNNNTIVTKPIEITSNNFKLLTDEYICSSGNIEHYYAVDNEFLDWIAINRKELIKTPDNLIEEKIMHSDSSEVFGIDHNDAYSVMNAELENNEELELLIGENLESFRYFGSIVDRELYKNMFENNIMDKFYYKNKHENALINFKEKPYLFAKIEQVIVLENQSALGFELVKKISLITEQENIDNSFSLEDIQVYINDKEMDVGYPEEIKYFDLKQGENKLEILLKYKVKNHSDNPISGDVEIITPNYDVYSNDEDGGKYKETQIKYVYGNKGQLNSNYLYNNFFINSSNTVLIKTNPKNNILADGQRFNIIVRKKYKNIKIRIKSKLIKDNLNEYNSLNSLSVLGVD